jgi:hypothetical protein
MLRHTSNFSARGAAADYSGNVVLAFKPDSVSR